MKRYPVLLCSIAFALSSCGAQTGSGSSSAAIPSSSSSASSSSNSSSSTPDSSSGSSSSATSSSSSSGSPKNGYYQSDTSSFRIDQHPVADIFSTYNSIERGMPSTGNVKILVFPVYFSDTSDPVPTNGDIDKINKAYFGSKSVTGWESLASYYEASSYNKLHISGTVTAAYKDSRTSTEFENDCKASDSYELIDLIDDILSYAKTSWGINTADYDSDSDGFIDVVELVYFTGRPLATDGGSDLWWAFTSITDKEANLDAPTVSRYFWSSFSMIASGYYTPDIDTHTLAHETGHALGLSDYYSYETGDTASAPAGGVDMMDFNMGDHNAYSKMVLGWASPLVIDGSLDSFSMTLHSFADTGEFILLRDTKTDPWNGMPYDEYLILQYYTPTNMNKQDSLGYKEWEGIAGWSGTYKTYGLQVFHVDSRMYVISGSFDPSTMAATTVNYGYTDTIVDEEIVDKAAHTFVTPSIIAANNTLSSSKDGATGEACSPYRKISIIPASKTTVFNTPDYDPNVGLTNNLFGLGSDYGSSSFSMSEYSANFPNGTLFNDGSALGYSFAVTSNDSSGCTLSFSSVS